MTKRTLQRNGYAIKHTSVGWWVDGRSGYLVAGYFPAEQLAVEAAGTAITSAKTGFGGRPAWLL